MKNRVAFSLLLLMLLLGVSNTLFAQIPVPIRVEGSSNVQGQPEDCAAQSAGQVSFSNFVGKSSDIWGDPAVDTIFLCADDKFDLTISGQDLTGDPDMSTPGGVGYAWYSTQPTVAGNDENTVGFDSHFLLGGEWIVSTGCAPSGNTTFKNTGGVQNTLDPMNAAPQLVWFAPITYDKLGSATPPTNTCKAIYENGGPCVKVSIDEAFPVVYLNTIQAASKQHAIGGFGCRGSFIVKGGLPEFDGSNYDIDISLQSDPSVKAMLLDDSYSHEEYVRFQVGEGGIYKITIDDGKSCIYTDTMLMAGCPSIVIDIPDTIGAQGDKICVPFTVKDFVNISSLEFVINWDSTVLSLDTTGWNDITGYLKGLTDEAGKRSSFNLLDSSRLVLVWSQFTTGITLNDNDVIFEICFKLFGPKGALSDVWISPNNNGIVIADPNGVQYGLSTSSNVGSVKIQNPNALDVVLDSTNLVCSGDNSGEIGVLLSGGAGYPVTMTWTEQGSGSNGTETFTSSGQHKSVTNLPAGVYDLHFVDAANGVLDTIIHLEDGRSLGANFDASDVLCNGDPVHMCAITSLEGVEVTDLTGYSFQWNNGRGTACFDTIVAGNNYSFTVTDPFGCTASAGGSPSQPSPVAANATVNKNPTCSGKTNGQIEVNPSGGKPDIAGNYVFSFENSLDTNVSKTLIGLDTGFYSIVVYDGNGCSVTETVHLNFDKEIVLSLNSQDISCAGSDDGEIRAQATNVGGMEALPYTFSWSPVVANTSNPNANVELATQLSPGTYVITVTDNDGCLDTISTSLSEPDSMTITLVKLKHQSCAMPAQDDGQISVSVSGGAGGYAYAWNSVAGGPDMTDLSPGAYTLEVTDANGCTKTKTYTVNPRTPPTINDFTKVNVKCPTDTDGSLDANLTPGNGTMIGYSWSTGSVDTMITGLAVGKYTLTITDEYGCTAELTDSIGSTQGYFLKDTTFKLPTCYGLSDGEIHLSMSDVSLSYNYFWEYDSGNTNNFALNIPSGTYNVTVSSSQSVCPPVEATLVLEEPHRIMTAITALDSVSCFDGSFTDGQANVKAWYSDNAPGNFFFTWGPNFYSCNNDTVCTASNLGLGQNVVAVNDADGCTAFDTIEIFAPDSILLQDVVITDVSCFGYSDGDILPIVKGGTPGTNPDYLYSWTPGGAGQHLQNASAGNYVLSVTDGVGCSETFNLVIDEPQLLELQIDDTKTKDVRCYGGSSGIIFVQATGGNGDETYQWSPDVSDTHVASLIPAGTYSVTVTDKKGCTQEITHTLSQNDPVVAQLAPIEPPECYGYQTVISVDTAYGGAGGPYNFSVDYSLLQSINIDYPVFADSHIVIIYDAFECTTELKVNITEPDEIYVSLPPSVQVELGDSVLLSPVVSSSLPIDSLFWTPLSNLSPDSVLSPQVIGLTQDQNYTITVVDTNGCSASATVLVEVDKNRNVYIPNIFSPNGDGFNDVFFPKTGIGVKQVNFMNIYDRWGEIIYAAKDFLPGDNSTRFWDGSYKGKALDPGVYIYLIEVEFLDGVKLLYRGDITLLK